MFQGSFEGVSRKIKGGLRTKGGDLRVYKRSSQGVSREFKEVLWVFIECLMCVSRIFLKSFNVISRMFQ